MNRQHSVGSSAFIHTIEPFRFPIILNQHIYQLIPTNCQKITCNLELIISTFIRSHSTVRQAHTMSLWPYYLNYYELNITFQSFCKEKQKLYFQERHSLIMFWLRSHDEIQYTWSRNAETRLLKFRNHKINMERDTKHTTTSNLRVFLKRSHTQYAILYMSFFLYFYSDEFPIYL